MPIAIIPVVVPPSGDGPIASIADLVGAKTVTLTGLFEGAYVLLASHNDANFDPVLTFNSDGKESVQLTLPDAYKSVRVRTIANTTGTVSLQVTGLSVPGENLFATLATFLPGSGGQSTVFDTAAIFPPSGLESGINVICAGGFSGTIVVEGGQDGDNFNPIGTFQAGQQQRPLLGGLLPVLEFSPLSTGENTRYLRFTLSGQVTSNVTLTVGGSIATSSPGPSTGPTIMPILPAGWGRYFFIDGDAGDDTHDGYIDAPLGTVFTSAQTAAHAIKTTDRLEKVTPMFGNEQSAIRLWKPRAGQATYDKKTPGDGLGCCDRRQLSGYAIIIDRGSDLTNSSTGPLNTSDRATLGCVASEGPFPVASVAGQTLTLTGATLPGPQTLTQRRLKISIAASGQNRFGAVRWGDMSSTAATNLVTAWSIPMGYGSAQPGDTASLEIPGVIVEDFYELINRPLTVDTTRCVVAGMSVNRNCEIGVNGVPAEYVMFFSPSNMRAVGSLVGATSFTDESTNVPIFQVSNPSVVVVGNLDSTSAVQSIELHQAAIASGQFHSDILKTDESNLFECQVFNGSQHVSITNCQHTDLLLSQLGHAQVDVVSQIPGGLPLTLRPSDTQVRSTTNPQPSYYLHDLYDLDGVSSGSPAVIISNGEYTITCDNRSGRNAGTGFRLILDESGSVSIDVSYQSLFTTGFEVIGGQKFICIGQNTGFDGDRLPCPRCKVSHFTSLEGDVFVEVGAVVYANPTGTNAVALLLASGTYTEHAPIGFTCTNANSNGGPCLVSSDSSGGVLQYEPGVDASTYPSEGAPLYCSAVTPGTVTTIPPARSAIAPETTPIFVGRVQPFGYDNTKATVVTTWQPGPYNISLALLAADYPVAAKIVLADVPAMKLFVRAEHSYRVKALVFVNAGSFGSRIALHNADAMDVCNLSYTFIGVSPGPTLAQAALFAAFDVDTTETAGNGYWIVDGSFRTRVDGFVTLQFAQAVSDPVSSTAQQGSYIEIVEQM